MSSRDWLRRGPTTLLSCLSACLWLGVATRPLQAQTALTSRSVIALPDSALLQPFRAEPVPVALPGSTRASVESVGPWTTPKLPSIAGISPWYAPALSAALPGAGQGLLRQQRGVAYAVAEGYLILELLRARRDATAERDAYREIARSVARLGEPGGRPDGPWAYYERLQSVLESGAYNATPSGTFTPEEDPTTFNGSIWLLARETYWLNPDVAPDPASAEYQRALGFYQRRAAGSEFLWSWRDAQLEQDLYRQTIVRANSASRRTRQIVGLLLANHALSLVDAYVSVRLRVFGDQQPDGSRNLGVQGSLPLPMFGAPRDSR